MTKKQKFILCMTIVILVFCFMVLLTLTTLDNESSFTLKMCSDFKEIEFTVDNKSKNEINLQPLTEDSSIE